MLKLLLLSKYPILGTTATTKLSISESLQLISCYFKSFLTQESAFGPPRIDAELVNERRICQRLQGPFVHQNAFAIEDADARLTPQIDVYRQQMTVLISH